MDEHDRPRRAAELLARGRFGPMALDQLPPEIRPTEVADAYAIQDALHALLRERGRGGIAGFKIGCTTPVMQAYLGISSPCAGGIVATTIHHGRGAFRTADYRRPGVECEIAVRLAVELEPAGSPYDRARVSQAVEVAMASIEIVDDRYLDYQALGVPTLVADDFFNAGCVLGPAVNEWRTLDLATIGGAMWINGEQVGTGRGSDILGHPLDALVWLANSRASTGRAIAAGSVISLGSVVRTHWVGAGDEVLVRLDGLGEASAHFD